MSSALVLHAAGDAYSSPLRADLAIHMVAARDIALKAAELLDALAFRGRTTIEDFAKVFAQACAAT